MGQSRRNLELKVACAPAALARRRALLDANGVPVIRAMSQRDVYLRVPDGRLKLRWITENRDGEVQTSAELIRYRRPDEAASRWSEYSVEPIARDKADALEARLIADHGLLTVVAKRRDVARWGATRVHLDEVDALGCFIELETVIAGQSDDEARREHQMVIRALALDDLPIVAESYSDLLLARR